MGKKDQIIKLKQVGLKNADIAQRLNVSKQYVSYVCQVSQGVKGQAKGTKSKEFVTTGAASRLLGVSEATIRRWSDQGKIPSFRVSIGRMDRRFSSRDLEQIIIRNGSPVGARSAQ
jgi:excisionase family DNA binding protein